MTTEVGVKQPFTRRQLLGISAAAPVAVAIATACKPSPESSCGTGGIIAAHPSPSIDGQVTYDVDNSRQGMPGNGVRAVLIDRAGLFLGFAGNNLPYNLTLLTDKGFQVCGTDVSGQVNGMTRNRKTGALVVATDGNKFSEGNGVYIQGKNGVWEHYFKIEGAGIRDNLRGLANAVAYCAVSDVGRDNRSILVGTLDGVSRYEDGIWFSVPALIMPTTNQRIHALLATLMPDGSKRTYVGMVMEGLGIVDEGQPARLLRAEKNNDDIQSNSIRAAVLNPNRAEVAIANGPWVSIHDLKADRWHSYELFPGGGVLGLAYDSTGRLIAVGDGGARLLNKKGSWESLSDVPSFSVAWGQKGSPFSEETLFVGTQGNGLVRRKLPLPA